MAIPLLINLHYEQIWTYECKRKKLVWHDEAICRGADIRVQIAVGTFSTVEGYGPEIREVLTNLIFNAVDAMPHGGTLRFNGRRIPRQEGEDADWVELDVQDTGIGIPEDIQRRIFDPFFTTKGLRGIGLGLSVAYGIMERHGGRITVASTPGLGPRLRCDFALQPLTLRRRRHRRRRERQPAGYW